jgi:hypothetical protein
MKTVEQRLKSQGTRRLVQHPGDTLVYNQGVRVHKVMIGHPTLGQVRIEWDVHRRGQVIPINFQNGEITASHAPPSVQAVGYGVADAQNVICERTVLDKYEWLLLWEDDVLPPFDALQRMNSHMVSGVTPLISGLYFSKGTPSWPLVFRGRGNGAFLDWQMGDQVWCDGVPTGFLMIHGSIISHMWHHSPEYKLPDGRKVRQVFEFPRKAWYDPETERYFSTMGTSDLYFCDRLRKENVLAKCGWGDLAKRPYPFLVDTRIFSQQITLDGIQYPAMAQEVLWPQRGGSKKHLGPRG